MFRKLKKLLPQYRINLKTVKVIKNRAESLIRWTQAAIAHATDLLLSDLPPAKTDEEAYVIYSRDYKVDKALMPFRNLESKLYLGLCSSSQENSSSQEKLKNELITEKGALTASREP